MANNVPNSSVAISQGISDPLQDVLHGGVWFVTTLLNFCIFDVGLILLGFPFFCTVWCLGKKVSYIVWLINTLPLCSHAETGNLTLLMTKQIGIFTHANALNFAHTHNHVNKVNLSGPHTTTRSSNAVYCHDIILPSSLSSFELSTAVLFGCHLSLDLYSKQRNMNFTIDNG